jgi:signal transduction histidine kinase
MLLASRRSILDSDDVRADLNRAKITLYSNGVSFLVMSVYFISDIALGVWFNVALDVVVTFLFVLGLYAFSKGHVTFTKLTIILVTNLALVLSASRDGRYSGLQFLMFPLLSCIFLFFSSKQYIYIVFSILVSILSILFLELTSYSLLASGLPDPEYLLANYFVCFGAGIFILLVYLFMLMRINKEAQRKLMEYGHRMRQKNAHLKKLHVELDGFVYKTTHDLRAPLNSLLGIIELCKIESDIHTIRNFVQLQEVSVRKLDAYIMDILNLARNSNSEVKREEVDMAEVVQDVFQQLGYMDTSVHRDVQVKQFSKLVTDRNRIMIILNNLLSNAFRYRDQHKSYQFVSLQVEVKEDMLVLIVKDNGLGIPTEFKERVFEMFFRINEKLAGSGLGLYIVKETVSKLGGSLELQSEQGHGTEFYVEIPNMK